MKKIIFALGVVLVIFLSFVPRSVEVFNKNYVFGYDQGRDYLAVKNIVIDHKFTLIGSEVGAGAAGFQGVFQGPGYFYLLTIPFLLFHGDPYGGVLLMFLFGLATIFAGFFVGKNIFGKWGGLMIALLLAISPPLISQSRFIWNPFPSTFFIIIALYFVFKIKESKNIYAFFAAFFAASVYNFEIAIAIPLCIALFFYTLLLFRLKRLYIYAFEFIGFLVAFSPLIFFEVRHKFTAINGVREYIFSNHSLTMGIFIHNLLFHINSYVYNFIDTFPHMFLQQYVFIFIFISGAAYFIIKEKDTVLKHFFYYLILQLIFSFFVFILLKTEIYAYYLIELNVAYIFVFSYILLRSWQRSNFIGMFLFTGIFLLFLITALIGGIKTYLGDFHDFGGTAKVAGKTQALDFVYKDAKGKSFGLLIFTPPIYTYEYDYLIWLYGTQKYHYIPYAEKKGTFYLLIQPDPYKVWSYNGWLQTVIKTGTIEKTWQLPSGFIIQKRIENL